MSDKKILLHICCGICASSVIEQLNNEGWNVEGFFYNPNIHPEEEYKKRLENVKLLLSETNTQLIEGKYDKEAWLNKIKGLEEEKEGGKRCQLCFQIRLEETLKEAKRRGINYFTTTLTISPHKKSQVINTIGQTLAQDSFITKNFKKNDGFKRAMELSKKYNLYHQNYCGCIFSEKEMTKKRE